MNELVSIIAPAYNHEKYIIEALNSISKQTYQNKELIVIDDCSSDRTPYLIENYIKCENIKKAFAGGITFIKHKKNLNAHKTINEGIELAQGKYIAIINTDDYFEHNRLEWMTKSLEQEKGRFAFSRVKIVNEKGEIKEYVPFEQMHRKIMTYPTVNLVLSVQNIGISTGNYFFEKDLYYEVGGFDSEYHFIHDWDFILKVTLITEPIYVDSTNYIYRFHETNTIKQIECSEEMLKKKDLEVKKVLEKYLKNIFFAKKENDLIPSKEVWDYFLNEKECCLASSIWNKYKFN